MAGYRAATERQGLNFQMQQANDARARMEVYAKTISDIGNQVQSTEDWSEKFAILGRNPQLWTDPNTRQAMAAMMDLTTKQYEVSTKTGEMSQLATLKALKTKTQSEIQDSFSKFLPSDRSRALTMYEESKGQMTQELYDFVGQAETRIAKDKSPDLILLDNIKELQDQGDIEGAKALSAILAKRASTSESTLQVGFDDQGRPIFTQRTGPTEGDSRIGNATVATQSQLQQDLVKKEKSLLLLNRLKSSIRPEDIGIKGVLGETIVDRSIAQFFPEYANKERISNRVLIGLVREGLLKQVSDDTRFSVQDRKAIEKLLPSSGFIESYPAMIENINELEKTIRERASINAQELGTTPGFLKSPEELKQAVQDGTMKAEEAADILTKFYPDLYY